MVNQFDHRFSTYEGATQAQLNVGALPRLDTAAHANPHRFTQPDYWVAEPEVKARLAGKTDRKWLLGWRGICRNSDQRTVIAVLTHDPQFDVPALKVALASKAGYIGAMGSRRTHENRLERLREAGVSDEELKRLHSPIGLDLGARTPEETAISIAAEIIQARWGGTARHLTDTDGPIHPGAPR